MVAFQPRKNELTAVTHRGLFDEFPGIPANEGEVKRWQAFRESYHQAQRLEGVAPFPLQLDFELNSTCQLKCGFCLHSKVRVKRKEIAFPDFARIIDEGEQYGLVSIKLNYINELLLLRTLPEYIHYARRHGVLNIYFATNGLLLDQDYGRALIEAGVSKIMISLDAATPETFEVMRNSHQFAEIVQNILGFIQLRNSLNLRFPLVRINFVQTRKNIHEVEQFVAMWEGVADMLGFQRQVQLPGTDDDLLPSAVIGDTSDFRCSFPFKLMVIDANGSILPCCTFSARPMAVGNIADMTIKQAWDSEAVRDLRETHLKYGYASIPICKHCVGGA
jgi:radical SAM protein with 4Fe4S-binding SPASM domain